MDRMTKLFEMVFLDEAFPFLSDLERKHYEKRSGLRCPNMKCKELST